MHVINEYYQQYRKLLCRELTEDVKGTNEYKVLSDQYPHLTQRILLKREKGRIKHELISSKRKSTLLQKKQKINAIDMRLRRENILTRIYGEKNIETKFNMRLKYENQKMHVLSLTNKFQKKLQKGATRFRSLDRTLRKFLSKRLPPTLTDLGSMYMVEKGLAVREWNRKRDI